MRHIRQIIKEWISNCFTSRPLRTKMILSNLVLAILPFMLVSAGFYGYLSKILEKKISDVTNTAFQGMDNRFNDYMTSIENISRICFYNPNFHRMISSPDKLYYQEKQDIGAGFLTTMILDKSIKDIAVVLSDGQMISAQGSVDEKSILAFQEDMRKYPCQGSFMYWSKDKIYPYNAYYVKPIKSINKQNLFDNLGIGVFVIDKRQLAHIYNSSSFQGIADIYLIDEDGTILDSNTKSTEMDKLDEKLRASSGDGIVTYNNMKCYVKSTDIKYSKFRLIAVIPVSIQYKELRITQMFLIFLLSLILILIVFVNMYFNYRFTLPLKKLSEAFAKFASNSFNTRIVIEDKDEVTSIVNQFNIMAKDVKETTNKIFYTQKKLYEIEIAKKQLEINLLYNQINSHFLYNTLSCIRGLSRSNSPQQVSKMINCLERYFRYTSMASEYATVQEEIDHLEIYLQIQNTRFCKEIQLDVQLPDNIRQDLIPKLILQPIVENSFTHGFTSENLEGIIQICFKRVEQYLCIYISDNGVGIDTDRLEEIKADLSREDKDVGMGKGIGLKNIKKRLEILFDNDYEFEIFSKKNEGTQILLRYKQLS